MIDPTKFSRLEITNARHARQWIPLRGCVIDCAGSPRPTVTVAFEYKRSLHRRMRGAARDATVHVVAVADGTDTAVPVRLDGVEFAPLHERAGRWSWLSIPGAPPWLRGLRRRNRMLSRDEERRTQPMVRCVPCVPPNAEVTTTWAVG